MLTLKIDKSKVLKTDGSLIQVERIEECSLEHSAIRSISLSDNRLLKTNV